MNNIAEARKHLLELLNARGRSVAANGNADWHTVHVPLGDRPEHQLPQLQLLDQE